MNKKNRITKIIKECNAINKGHYEFVSGLHGEKYFEKLNIIKHPHYVNELCKYLADEIQKEKIMADMICSPAIGGFPFGYITAFHLKLNFVFLEHQSQTKFSIRRSFMDSIKNARIIFIDDIKTTGKTMDKCIKFLQTLGGEVVHAGFIADVKNVQNNSVVPYTALISNTENVWNEKECPLCKKNIPLKKLSDIRGLIKNEF